jgi:antitoxin ParD1/3/4
MSQELHIALPEDLEQRVAVLLESGEYRDANDIVIQALRILIEQREEYSATVASIRHEIRRGLEQSDRGEVMDGEEFFRALEERFGDTR